MRPDTRRQGERRRAHISVIAETNRARVNSFGGAESAFSRDGKKLLYYHNGANAPNDVSVYEVGTGKSTQVTHSLMAGVPAEHMVEPVLVHYPSRDGKWTISAWVYVTRNMQRNGQNAAIV